MRGRELTMSKRLSKFEYDRFQSGYDDFAVSKQRYTKNEAIKLAKEHIGYTQGDYTLSVCNAWVVHRAGVSEDGEPVVGWWLEYKMRPRSCPVWAFHVAGHEGWDRKHGYEHIAVHRTKEDAYHDVG